VAALVCAIYFGLLQTLLIGGALYLAAFVIVGPAIIGGSRPSGRLVASIQSILR
jgi:hypothetical protein